MPLVDERAAAERLGVSVAFLRADRSRCHVGGRTPGPPWYRVGRAIRYSVSDLEQWLATRRVDRARATDDEPRRATAERSGRRAPVGQRPALKPLALPVTPEGRAK